MNFYINITRTLILVYVLSVFSCAYLLCLNDLMKKKLSSDNLAGCLILSLIPVLNLCFASHAAVDNFITFCRYYKFD